MARETKAERLEREALARQMAEAALRSEYPARLMRSLDRAVNSFNYELTVREELFVLTDRDADYDWERQVELSYSWSEDAQDYLDTLDSRLDCKAAERFERERRRKVEEEARRKVRELLTEEERELLGL